MKKILFYSVVLLLIFSFTGCDFLKGGDSADFYAKTVANKIYELDSTSVKSGKFEIPDEVGENDQVFVVQVNLGNKAISKSGTLNNEISDEDLNEFKQMYRSAEFDEESEPVVNEIPGFVEQFKKLPKHVGESVNYNVHARLAAGEYAGGDLITIKLPKDKDASLYDKNDFEENVAELKYESNYSYVYYIPLAKISL